MFYYKIKTRFKRGSSFEFDVIGNINIKIDNINYDDVPIIYFNGKFFVEKTTEESKKISEDVLQQIEKTINKSSSLNCSVKELLYNIETLKIIRREENVQYDESN